jgi:hypothetical protein
MLNHFRTLLLNLSDVGNANEHIAPGFVARNLSDKPLALYRLLFPTTTRDRILKLGHSYLELLESTQLGDVITLQDPRISYDLKVDFDDFKSPGFNIEDLWGKIYGNSGLVESVLAIDKQVDTDKYDNIWRSHPNRAYRLAGLIAAYGVRLK